MGKGNDVERVSAVRDAVNASDLFHQRTRGQELLDGQPSHRKHELGPKKFLFAVEPWLTQCNLFPRGDTVTPVRILTWEAATNSRHVDAAAKLRLVQTNGRKPLEKLFARRPGKRAPQCWLLVSGRLPHQKHA